MSFYQPCEVNFLFNDCGFACNLAIEQVDDHDPRQPLNTQDAEGCAYFSFF